MSIISEERDVAYEMIGNSINFKFPFRISEYDRILTFNLDVVGAWIGPKGKELVKNIAEMNQVVEALKDIGEFGSEMLKKLFPIWEIKKIEISPCFLRVIFFEEDNLDKIWPVIKSLPGMDFE